MKCKRRQGTHVDVCVFAILMKTTSFQKRTTPTTQSEVMMAASYDTATIGDRIHKSIYFPQVHMTWEHVRPMLQRSPGNPKNAQPNPSGATSGPPKSPTWTLHITLCSSKSIRTPSRKGQGSHFACLGRHLSVVICPHITLYSSKCMRTP